MNQWHDDKIPLDDLPAPAAHGQALAADNLTQRELEAWWRTHAPLGPPGFHRDASQTAHAAPDGPWLIIWAVIVMAAAVVALVALIWMVWR